MYSKNLTVKELYSSIFKSDYIAKLFADGLAMNNDGLAISAAKELMERGDYLIVRDTLDEAFDSGVIVKESSLISLLGRTLMDNTRGLDPILCHYGGGLLRGDYMGPSKWYSIPENQERVNGKKGRLANILAGMPT